MKFSVSSYSFQQFISAKKMTQLDAIRVASEMGFDGIEFTDLRPNDAPTHDEQLDYAKKIRCEAEKYGIEVVAYLIGADLCKGEDEIRRVMGQVDIAATMGAKLLRHDVCYSEKKDGRTVGFDALLPSIADAARRITEYAQTKGICTMTENHGFVAQDSDRLEKLFYAVGHENYGLLIDFGNFACVDENSITAVSRLAPYAFHVHAKDFHICRFGESEDAMEGKYFLSRGCNKLFGCAIGDGDIPVAQCVAIMKRAKYEGYLTIEFEGSGDCMQEIARGLKNLRSYES